MRSHRRLFVLAFIVANAAVVPALAAREISVPLFFVPNQRIADPEFQYLAQTPRLRAGFARNSVAFQFPQSQIRLRFPGSHDDPGIHGEMPLAGRANFFTGATPDQWHTDVPAFEEIRYRDLYPGIDLVYKGSGGSLKSEFIVAPGADPSRIVLRYSGAVAIASNGDLLIGDGAEQLREQAPVVFQGAFQNIDRGLESEKTVVQARYRLLDEHTAVFELGDYDSSKPLIIDPVISYSTYLGGSNSNAVTATAVDSSGNLYVAGWTSALDFPASSPLQHNNAGGVDAFVVKLNSTGTAIIYADYLGGRNDDRAAGIAVDAAGEAYIAGATTSTNFPLVSPIRSILGGSKTAFVSKLNSAGNALVFSTYLGGTAVDAGTAIALDSSGNAWVAGDTQSANFPVLLPLQSFLWGTTDIFLTKLTPAGALAFSTFWGGSLVEHAGGVTLDSSGNIYVAGGTFSLDLPVVAPLQRNNAGNQDAFVLKINSSATAIIYATYLGGSGTLTGELANGIAADPAGNAYVTGVTNSSNFPVTAGTTQKTYGGLQDSFVTKINSTGSAFVYSTYLGGSDFDWANAIALDTAGDVYIGGYTASFDFPVTGGLQAGFAGAYDGFITMLNSTGGVLVFSTYYGGSGAEEVNALTVDASGNIFAGGQTSSVNLPLHTPLQSTNRGGQTGWVARFGVTAAPPQTPAVVSVTPSLGTGATVIFTARYSDTGGGAALATAGLLINTSAGTDFACWITYSPATNLFSLANDVPSSGSVTTVPGGASIQNDLCVLNGAASSVAISGNTLTLTVSLFFQSFFVGPKTVFLSAADAGASTGFVALGSWTAVVAPPAPSVVSVAPNAGIGAGQTFVFNFADASSANNLSTLAMLFSTSSATLTNSCYIVVDRNAGTIALLWDTVLGSSSKLIGSLTTLQNSQCLVSANSLTLSGQAMSLAITIAFTGTFNGSKNIYLAAAEKGVNTGFVQEGVFTVVAAGIPTAVSAVPNTGSGTGQRFSFTIADPGGSNFLIAMGMLFASPFGFDNQCSMVWDSHAGTISLAYDIQANGAQPVIPGTNTTASNAQCTLNAANSTVQIDPTSVTVTVDMTFKAAWAGTKTIFLYAAETASNSGWVTEGTWTVTSGSPTANSVSPGSGAGHFPTFVFTASDSAFAANITSANILFTVGAPSNVTNECYVVFNRNTSQVGLYNDAGTILTNKGIGSATSLSNSQCAVGYTAVTTSGVSVFFTLQVQFTSATFAGAKTVYLEANEPTATTGFVAVGGWTAQ